MHMALLLAVSNPTSEATEINAEPVRHRGRPALSDKEREERRRARNEARRLQRKAARAAAVEASAPPPPVVVEVPAPAPPVATPAPPPAPAYPLAIRCALAVLGFALGAFVPLASYTEVHTEVSHRPLLWFLVAGGLIYSSTSVYSWAVKFLPHWTTALGFVVLLELTLTFCGIPWLSQAGLAILMMLNAINAATRLYASTPSKPPTAKDEASPNSGQFQFLHLHR